jgi:gas vesicle protein
MAQEPEEPRGEPDEAESGDEHGWDTTSFLTGLALGAAVGAGLALLFAPAAGEATRRLFRSRARAVTRDAADSWVATREEAREAIREKKELLRRRLAKGLQRAEDRLGV